MRSRLRLGIIGDYNPSAATHIVTDQAITHAAKALHLTVHVEWIETTRLTQAAHEILRGFDAIWCAPGSPYRSMQGALEGIRFARDSHIPFLGTCAGFQHVVIEYARNVLGFADAQHAEYDPAASHLFINQLACSLAGKKMTIVLDPKSRAIGYYGRAEVMEQYYCRFGLNPHYQPLFKGGELKIAGYDTDGEARIVELADHPFFTATLFLPQLDSTLERPHPLITAFLQSALAWQEGRRSQPSLPVGESTALPGAVLPTNEPLSQQGA
jgi:CTP synthase (UTP-ammonia lyase)